MVLVLGQKVTCFFARGIEIDRVRAEINLVFVWVVVVEIDSVFRWGPRIAWLYVVWAKKLSWLLSGWSISTWFQCGGSNLAWFQFRDRKLIYFVYDGGRKWSGFSIWIQIVLNFVWWCSTANGYGVLTDGCVCYAREECSVTVDWVAQWFIPYKRTNEGRASNSSQADWVAQWFIRYKRPTDRASNPTEVALQIFFLNAFSWNSSRHDRQAPSKSNDKIGRHPSYIIT